MRLERVDRKSIEGRHEHDHRQAFLRHLRQHVEPREARHLDVEEHQVGMQLGDRGQCLAAVRALARDLDVRRVLQAQLQPAARERFVIDDDGADAHGCTALSKGSVISMRSPGRENRTASVWCSP
jgi:hypothetical protein